MSYKPALSDHLKRHWWKIIFIPLLVFKLLELQFKARVFTILFKFWLYAFIVTSLAWGFGAWLLYCAWRDNDCSFNKQAGFIIGVSLFLFIPSVCIIILGTCFNLF
jgi:hypothetical protein